MKLRPIARGNPGKGYLTTGRLVMRVTDRKVIGKTFKEIFREARHAIR